MVGNLSHRGKQNLKQQSTAQYEHYGCVGNFSGFGSAARRLKDVTKFGPKVRGGVYHEVHVSSSLDASGQAKLINYPSALCLGPRQPRIISKMIILELKMLFKWSKFVPKRALQMLAVIWTVVTPFCCCN